MVNINALGIIFPNTYDELVPQLVKHRTMASVPFGGRYRMIDFTLSGMERRHRKRHRYRKEELSFSDGSSRLRT